MPAHLTQRDSVSTDSTCSEDGRRLLNKRFQLMEKRKVKMGSREGMSRGRKGGKKLWMQPSRSCQS